MHDKNILFYPSGHGFGHAVRQSEVIKEIFRLNFETGSRHKVFVRTDAPLWIIKNSLDFYFEKLYPERAKELSGWLEYHKIANDVGTYQKDSLTMDIERTYREASEFYGALDARASFEAEFIKSRKIDAVVGDIPPLAFEAANRANVVSIGISNFSWDYIYEEFVEKINGFSKIIDIIKKSYSKCSRFLRLPFACPLDAFGRVSDTGLIARKPYLTKEEVLKKLNIDPLWFSGKKTVMISFGGFVTEGFQHANLAKIGGYNFFTTIGPAAGEIYPENVKYIDTRTAGISFENLFKIFDVIATKPGYGVVGDIIGAGSACLYTDRGPFREYPYLVGALERHAGASEYITHIELLNCDFAEKLSALERNARSGEPISLMGAAECANAILGA